MSITKTHLMSCILGDAATPLRLTFDGVQYTSASAADRGQTIGSRLAGSLCSLQRSVWPPMILDRCASGMPEKGEKP